MTCQMLATPLFAVPEILTDRGILQVLGFTAKGDPYCVQIGERTGVRPTRAGVWDQSRYGRLGFYSTMADATNAYHRARDNDKARTTQFVHEVETHLSERAR